MLHQQISKRYIRERSNKETAGLEELALKGLPNKNRPKVAKVNQRPDKFENGDKLSLSILGDSSDSPVDQHTIYFAGTIVTRFFFRPACSYFTTPSILANNV